MVAFAYRRWLGLLRGAMIADWTKTWAPDADQLAKGLRSAISPQVAVTVIDRRSSIQASSFPAEVLTCRLGDGSTVELLCKYGVGHVESGCGHRAGVSYESRVFRDLLAPLNVNTPGYWGRYSDPDGSGDWLVVEFLAAATQLQKSRDSFRWLVEAARWIGDFQRRCCTLPNHKTAFLTRYTPRYFSGWADRTFTFTQSWHESLTWLPELCKAYSARGGMLASSEIALIHGEYYPKNILIDRDKVCPVDWESAAIAPGEIDLASLTEGNWPEDVVGASIDAYIAARWSHGAPSDFASNLAAARLYLHLRWLGDNETWTVHLAGSDRISLIRELGEELGLI
jgi:hypothetical protein